MLSRRAGALLLSAAVVGLVLTAGLTRDHWLPWFTSSGDDRGEKPSGESPDHDAPKRERVELSPQAVANLRPEGKALQLSSFEKTADLPGIVVDRPGQSDRGVPAPLTGIVTRVHVEPGLAVSPGDPLFTVRVTSEYLQNAQAELFKTASEMALNRRQRSRLAEQGVVPEARLIELDQQHARLEVAARAHTQDLLSRGLTPEQVEEVRRGDLIREVLVKTPKALPGQKGLVSATSSLAYEVQEIKVDVGHQVQAGQVLAFLANHHSLAVEGRALTNEAGLVERAARAGWPVGVTFIGDDPASWDKYDRPRQTYAIRYVSNMIDPAKRLLVFQVPLVNQCEPLEKDGRTFLLWRYRPGQRVRVSVPVERWEKVFKLPAAAVVQEGPEAYVFRQDGDTRFDRKPVRLLHIDRDWAVLDPQGSSVSAGQWVAHNGAAVLNRVLKSQGESDEGQEHHHH
jgi:multidrug efflux pump subunit AcrA (membrane-fusion protein)